MIQDVDNIWGWTQVHYLPLWPKLEVEILDGGNGNKLGGPRECKTRVTLSRNITYYSDQWSDAEMKSREELHVTSSSYGLSPFCLSVWRG